MSIILALKKKKIINITDLFKGFRIASLCPWYRLHKNFVENALQLIA
jgi:hypothetical protein